MPSECLELLNVKEDGIYVDGTLGRGGHSKLILDRLTSGKLYCFDLDQEAIKESKENLKNYCNVEFIHDNFKNMSKYISNVDGILLDLGVSSPQFDTPDRGFSYRNDGPLDMRMNKEDGITCEEVINNYSLEELTYLFKTYGEEKFAYKIAYNIVKQRQVKPIKTTFELVDIIKKSKPAKELAKKGHPAKQCFQALRIEVNKELDSLKEFLDSFDSILNENGRVVIITFQSLEDKLVKAKFKELSYIEVDKRIALLPDQIEKPKYKLLNHKVIVASEDELNINNRSKSAKLRGIEKVVSW